MNTAIKTDHTTQQYADFLETARDYLNANSNGQEQKSQRPHVQASHHIQTVTNGIEVCFSNEVMENMVEKPDPYWKPFETVVKYGYRGISSGEKNGIFQMRQGDDRLKATAGRLTVRNRREITDEFNITEQGLDALKQVKIVTHNTTGKRMVGVYETRSQRIMILGFGNY